MLVSLKEVIAEGRKRHMAIGSFNTPTLESLEAVLEAAEELDVPVIVAHAQLHESCSPINYIGRVMVELAKNSKVKVCVHLDHGEDIEYLKKAIDLGFTSVMIDCSTRPYEENIATSKEVVDYAHMHHVDVEAELGALPAREGGEGAVAQDPTKLYTNPEMVNDFVSRTGIDALAIAFGTAHGIYKTTPVLNLDIISEVRKRNDIPLVMHGGSGISAEMYRQVIARGIDKINYYTYMAYEGYAKCREEILKSETGKFHNLAFEAKEAMKANVLKTLRVFSGLDRE